jgi:transcription-repair coupling factor (superfamily II helicase)
MSAWMRIELEYTGFIPDGYISNAQIKMEIYKKIASISERDEIALMQNELLDRFGPVPEEVSSLLALAEIRVLCKGLAITTIKEKGGKIQVEFGQVAKVSAEKVVKLITQSGGKVRLDQRHPNVLLLDVGAIGLVEKSVYLREKLEKLSA